MLRNIKEKLINMKIGSLHLDSTKNLISESLKGDKNPFFNKRHSLKTKLLISKIKSKGEIYIYDSLLNLQVVVSSLRMLSKNIRAHYNTLNSYIINNKLFRGN
jgi:group I intron endonuclease